MTTPGELETKRAGAASQTECALLQLREPLLSGGLVMRRFSETEIGDADPALRALREEARCI